MRCAPCNRPYIYIEDFSLGLLFTGLICQSFLRLERERETSCEETLQSASFKYHISRLEAMQTHADCAHQRLGDVCCPTYTQHLYDCDQCFAAAGSRVWNFLLAELRQSDCLKLAFHDATPTPAPTRTSSPTSSRGSSRECRRVVELAIGITSGNRASDVSARILARMSVSVFVEFRLKPSRMHSLRSTRWLDRCCSW